MPNLANVLKTEIARIARKESRALLMVLQRSSSQYRRDIAALKRQVATLERKVALLEKKAWSELPATTPDAEDSANIRFSAKGLASHRSRLGLTVADYAKLLQVSVPTLYNWENGKTRPRQEQLVRLAALRKITKREALARLEQMG